MYGIVVKASTTSQLPQIDMDQGARNKGVRHDDEECPLGEVAGICWLVHFETTFSQLASAR
eukprot:3252157-Amphidinium_carterae.1